MFDIMFENVLYSFLTSCPMLRPMQENRLKSFREKNDTNNHGRRKKEEKRKMVVCKKERAYWTSLAEQIKSRVNFSYTCLFHSFKNNRIE